MEITEVPNFMSINTKIKFFTLSIVLACAVNGYGQINGLWPNSHYTIDPLRKRKIELQGKVHFWEMTAHDGAQHILNFDRGGKIVNDNFTGTKQSFLSPVFAGMDLKDEFEKKHANTSSDSCYIYNKRNQLLEIRTATNSTKNTFDKSGNILVHREATISKNKRYFDTPGHNPPYCEFTDKSSLVIIYRYKNKLVSEIKHYSSNPHQNYRLVYLYNERNQLIERRFYDSNEIHYRYITDNYLDLFPPVIDSTFSIDSIYKDYWGQNQPAVERWKYNEKGNLIENTNHFKHETTSRIVWNYNSKNRLVNEVRYDTYKDRIFSIIDFDSFGNVIRERIVGYDGDSDKTSTIKIQYY